MKNDEVLYVSDIFLTPYTNQKTIDSERLGEYISGQYSSAQIRSDEVDTGAIILTGIALRKQNARAIGELFALETGKFVSVSAGDQMEATLAALGSGAVVNSRDIGINVMNVDIGGGTTEIAIISLNGVVYSESVRVGGDRFDESITTHVRRNYGSLIGDATAERIKKEIGCAYTSASSEIREIDVRGRNLAEGVPRSFTLNSDEILEALQEPLAAIVQAVKSALEQLSLIHI